MSSLPRAKAENSDIREMYVFCCFQYEERRSLITQICRSDEEARDKSSMAATVEAANGASYIAVDRRDRVAYCSIAKGGGTS